VNKEKGRIRIRIRRKLTIIRVRLSCLHSSSVLVAPQSTIFTFFYFFFFFFFFFPKRFQKILSLLSYFVEDVHLHLKVFYFIFICLYFLLWNWIQLNLWILTLSSFWNRKILLGSQSFVFLWVGLWSWD